MKKQIIKISVLGLILLTVLVGRIFLIKGKLCIYIKMVGNIINSWNYLLSNYIISF